MLNHINGGFNNDDNISGDSDSYSDINTDDYVYC
jgi:hypothetical protein